jgi:hypothetical protein
MGHHDEAISVAAEGAAKEAEDADKMEVDGGGWDEAADGWYGVVEEASASGPGRNAARLAFHHAAEEHLAEMTRKSAEHEATVRAGRRCLGDLIGRKNELIAQVTAHRLL